MTDEWIQIPPPHARRWTQILLSPSGCQAAWLVDGLLVELGSVLGSQDHVSPQKEAQWSLVGLVARDHHAFFSPPLTQKHSAHASEHT